MRRFAAAALIGAAVLAGAAPAAADAVPFKDSNTVGFIALCDRAGHPVTSGDVSQLPFVWRAISSTAVPKPYTGGKAVLLAVQPREQVDPGEWSAGQLTASTTYTNPAHPVAAATEGDGSLLSFVQAFPARWQGLVQLRMYYSAQGLPPHRRTYPATTLRVSGTRWQVVDGGSLSCSVGSGTSVESVYLSKLRASAHPSGGTAASAVPIPRVAPGAATSATAPGARRTSGRGFVGSAAGYLLLVVVLGALAGLAGSAYRRFRPSR